MPLCQGGVHVVRQVEEAQPGGVGDPQTGGGYHRLSELLNLDRLLDERLDAVRVVALRGASTREGGVAVDLVHEVDDGRRDRCGGAADGSLGRGDVCRHGHAARKRHAELAVDGIHQFGALLAEPGGLLDGRVDDRPGAAGADGDARPGDRRGDVENGVLPLRFTVAYVVQALQPDRTGGRVGDQCVGAVDQLLDELDHLVGVGRSSDGLQRTKAAVVVEARPADLIEEAENGVDVCCRECGDELLTDDLRRRCRRRSDGSRRCGGRRTGTQRQRRGGRDGGDAATGLDVRENRVGLLLGDDGVVTEATGYALEEQAGDLLQILLGCLFGLLVDIGDGSVEVEASQVVHGHGGVSFRDVGVCTALYEIILGECPALFE